MGTLARARAIIAPVEGEGYLPNAGLASASELAIHNALHRQLHVGIVKDDERRVSAQFQADFLECVCGQLREHLPDICRARETNLSN